MSLSPQIVTIDEDDSSDLVLISDDEDWDSDTSKSRTSANLVTTDRSSSFASRDPRVFTAPTISYRITSYRIGPVCVQRHAP